MILEFSLAISIGDHRSPSSILGAPKLLHTNYPKLIDLRNKHHRRSREKLTKVSGFKLRAAIPKHTRLTAELLNMALIGSIADG